MPQMKLGFAFILLGLLAQSAFPCSCITSSLSKRFRSAEAIFIGRLAHADEQMVRESEIQNYSNRGLVLKVSKSWKGVRKELVEVEFDKVGVGGTCPFFYEFKPETEYLVFAYGPKLEIQSVCSDTKILGSGHTTADVKRLSNFWFRTRARLWPF
jgi:hypothetical protein